MQLAAAFLCVLAFMLLTASGGKVRPFHLTFATFGVILLGYARLVESGGAPRRTLDLQIAALIALVLGYLGGRSLVPPTGSQWFQAPSPAALAALRRTTQVVIGLGLLHFAVVGLPILSDTPQRARWNFTGSGFYGLPGRAQLFGVTVALALAFAVTRGAPEGTSRRYLAPPILALVAFGVVGGFKGGLLQIVVHAAFVQLALRPTTGAGAMLRRYGGWLAIALLFAVSVASMYQSAGGRAEGTLSGIVDRATLTPAKEGALLIELADAGERLVPGNTIVNDFRTLAGEYLPGFGGEHDQFVAVYSARLHGRSLIGDLFIVPVTPQGFPVLYYNHGMFAWVLMAAVGVLYGAMERLAANSRSAGGACAAVVACIVLHYFVVKGDLAFLAINWGAMWVFVLGCFTAVRVYYATTAMPQHPSTGPQQSSVSARA